MKELYVMLPNKDLMKCEVIGGCFIVALNSLPLVLPRVEVFYVFHVMMMW